jgi:hypothetical protein
MSESIKLQRQTGAVRLTLPARVANNLDGLQRALEVLAERLGHPACATGCDTLFLQLEREFTLSDAVELNPQPLPPGPPAFAERQLPLDPIPMRTVQVIVPERVTDDIGALQKAIAVTVGKLGCDACCSGFNIAFQRELDLIAINESLEVQGFGSFR